MKHPSETKKPQSPISKAIRLYPLDLWLTAHERPVVFRPCLAAGLAFS